MEALLDLGLTNAAVAAVLAVAAALVARLTRQPPLWYLLWLVVVLRLLAPPLVGVEIGLPDLGLAGTADQDTAMVAVTNGAITAAEPGQSIDPLAVIAAIWLAGALVVAGVAVEQSLRLRRVIASSTAAPPEVAARVAAIAAELGLRRPPPTVMVAGQVPPMLWSLFGTVRLLLPEQLVGRLNRRQTDTILAHELAHLSRRDHLVRHLELAAAVLFWWHPVAWWAIRRLRRAQELCCDLRVAELLPGHRRAYADCLVETARFLSGHRQSVASPARAMADLTQMKGRIHMIMTANRARELSLAARITAAVILVTVLAITPVLTAQSDEPDDLGRPISLTLENADLLDVLATFSEISAVEILIEPGISGTVTASFDEVPWDQALYKVIQSQGLTCQRDGDQMIVRRAGSEALVPVQPADAEPSIRLAGKLDGAEVFRYVPDAHISEPVAIEKVPPKYPPEARKAGISGPVVADLVIDEIGNVRDVVIQKSPSDELSAAAIEAFERWRFEPAMMDGEPVAVRYIVTVMFRLE